jgi:hypothetical protein
MGFIIFGMFLFVIVAGYILVVVFFGEIVCLAFIFLSED